MWGLSFNSMPNALCSSGIRCGFAKEETIWINLNMSGLVQYIIVRSDLKSVLNWPLGAIIAQCCHATAAVMHLYKEDSETLEYLKELDSMHKVVLEIKDEDSINALSEKLQENGIKHKLWIEQPENYPTCIAVKPYPKESVHKFVKSLKLMK